MIQAEFQERFGVSRETIDRLASYEALIQKWNPVINLVSKSTLSDVWSRHFLESAEVFRIANLQEGLWVDLGTGGGFPGAVVAVLAADLAPRIKVTCIESDIRKCEFLRTVSRTTGVPFGVMSRRIEEVPPQNAAVVSARALAPLDRLLGMLDLHLAKEGRALLFKGGLWRSELDLALESWRFDVEKYDSPTNLDSAILSIGDISRA